MRTRGARRGFWATLVTALLAVTPLSASAAVDYDALLFFSSVPDAAGYRVYMKRNGGSYDPPVDIGRRSADADGVVTYALSSLTLVNRTHFGVTSYDARGVESDMSNEIALDRAIIAASAGAAQNEDPTPPASAEEEDRLSVEVPLSGWERSSGRGSFALQQGTLITSSDDDNRPLEVRYPGQGSLGSRLPEATFRFRADATSELSALVRVAGGGWRRLYYLVEEGPPRVRGKRAYVPIGSDTGMRELRRDLAADVERMFGSEFLHIEHVSIRGAVELARLTLRERGQGADAPKRAMAVPVATWGQTGRASSGPVADEEIGSIALASDGSRRLTFPGREGRLVAPFERVSVLVRDQSPDFAVYVQVETSLRQRRWLSFGSNRRDSRPLEMRSGNGSPYQTALLDVRDQLATIAPGESLKNIRHIRFTGEFQVTGVRVLEPLG